MHKIAVYFSGRIRGYEHTLDKLKAKFFDKYDCDFFMSIDLEKPDKYHENIHDILKPIATNYDKYDRPFSKLPTSPCECRQRNTLSMFYHNFYSQKIILDHIRSNNIKYHAIVKFRLDISSEDDFYIPDQLLPNTVYIPNGSNYRGINDQICFGDVRSMIVYGTVYMHIPNYIYVKKAFLSSEYLLNFHLNENNMNILRFPYSYELHKDRFNKPPLLILEDQ